MSTKQKILASIAPVIKNSKYVSLNAKQIPLLAKKLLRLKPPQLNNALQFLGTGEETIHYYFFLNNLNFCSWPKRGKEKWFYDNHGEWISGYYGKAVAIKNAFTSDKKFFDPEYLAAIPYQDFVEIFKGKGEMQLMQERHALIQECYRIVAEKFGGNVTNIIKQADYDANKIVELLVGNFPRFKDVASFHGRPVYFLKLAQIVPSDFNNALGKPGKPYIKNLQDLTIFADTLIPQLLQNEGVVVYNPSLLKKIKQEELLLHGSQEEMEIRASAIFACEQLRDELEQLGRNLTSNELDWILWTEAKKRTFPLPYHRTLSIFY